MRKKSFTRRWMEQWDLQILIIPSILMIIVFSYIPMYGMVMAFQEFRLGDFPGISEWVGLRHFVSLFEEPNFLRSIRNTIVISLLKLIVNFPLPILFAVILNELNLPIFKKTVQTVSYLPHFISWVVCAKLMFDLLAGEGAINELLVNMGILSEPIVFFNRANYFWGIAVLTDLWKELGFSSIIFLAAIASIDQEIYEAADIDGATRLQKMRYITLSSIKPTIALMFVFAAGGMLNANFDQIMMLTNQMGNSLLRETADVIDTYVYRIGISNARYSFASAAGLFKSLINFALLLIVNKLSDKMADTAVL